MWDLSPRDFNAVREHGSAIVNNTNGICHVRHPKCTVLKCFTKA